MIDPSSLLLKVERGSLISAKGDKMSASCHHRKSGACGGCYARFWLALKAIQEAPVLDVYAIVDAVFAATKREAGK
jgi:hypothetical protein